MTTRDVSFPAARDNDPKHSIYERTEKECLEALKLEEAMRQVDAKTSKVVLEPFQQGTEGRVALHLPEGVRWGRPLTIPLPPSLADSGWRDGHPRPISVMPQRRALANVWFLHHGRQALCLRLDLSGAVELLRYRPLLGAWIAC